jgi:hypothetical protein
MPRTCPSMRLSRLSRALCSSGVRSLWRQQEGATLSVGTADASTAGAVAASGWAGVPQQQQGFFSLSIKYLLYP